MKVIIEREREKKRKRERRKELFLKKRVRS